MSIITSYNRTSPSRGPTRGALRSLEAFCGRNESLFPVNHDLPESFNLLGARIRQVEGPLIITIWVVANQSSGAGSGINDDFWLWLRIDNAVCIFSFRWRVTIFTRRRFYLWCIRDNSGLGFYINNYLVWVAKWAIFLSKHAVIHLKLSLDRNIAQIFVILKQGQLVFDSIRPIDEHVHRQTGCEDHMSECVQNWDSYLAFVDSLIIVANPKAESRSAPRDRVLVFRIGGAHCFLLEIVYVGPQG